MPKPFDQEPHNPVPSYADPAAISEFSHALTRNSTPERIYTNVYDDAKYVWKQARKAGSKENLTSTGEDEQSTRVTDISTFDLSGDWADQPPSTIRIRTSYIDGEDSKPRIKILDLEIYDDFEEDSKPLYLGSLAIAKPSAGSLPNVRYDLSEEDSISDWVKLSPNSFKFDAETNSASLVTASEKATTEELQLKSLLATLEAIEGYFFDAEDNNGEQESPASILGRFSLRALADRVRPKQ